jgi:hypothetical protein
VAEVERFDARVIGIDFEIDGLASVHADKLHRGHEEPRADSPGAQVRND